MSLFLTQLKDVELAKILYAIKVRCLRSYTVNVNDNERGVTSIEFVVHDKEVVKQYVTLTYSYILLLLFYNLIILFVTGDENSCFRAAYVIENFEPKNYTGQIIANKEFLCPS